MLDRTLDLAAEQRNVAAWAATVAARFPELAGPATALASALTAAFDRLPEQPAVPIHKDFHYQHVLVGDRGPP